MRIRKVGALSKEPPGEWRYVGASVVGVSHRRDGGACQDRFALEEFSLPEGQRALLLACADGAGTARHSDLGAELACQVLKTEVRGYIAERGTLDTLCDLDLQTWFVRAQGKLLIRAREDSVSVRELACTLVMGVLWPGGAGFAQLGDGAIVCSDGVDFQPVFWPQSGEYANSTFFVTQPDHLPRTMARVDPDPPEEVALLTDGLERLALHFEDQTAHAPFFRPMFAKLREGDPGFAQHLAAALQSSLESEDVCKRTDDDKTLLLATRIEQGTVPQGDG